MRPTAAAGHERIGVRFAVSIIDDEIAKCTDVLPLAQGGQKVVFAGDHPEFGQVVLKRGEFRHASIDRIAREVELLSGLSSRYFPRHFTFLIDTDDREFLVVEERLDAVELTEVGDRFREDRPLRALVTHLIRALGEIWKRRVVHRDLKPPNILITSNGEPRVIDLGIARFLDETSLTHSLAMRGPGTPVYAAPEQLQNKKSIIGPRTDFFLLALLALELMHGFHPFDPRHVGNGLSSPQNILSGAFVPPPPHRDRTLVEFIERSLEPQPFKRFRTVSDLMDHFDMDDA